MFKAIGLTLAKIFMFSVHGNYKPRACINSDFRVAMQIRSILTRISYL